MFATRTDDCVERRFQISGDDVRQLIEELRPCAIAQRVVERRTLLAVLVKLLP